MLRSWVHNGALSLLLSSIAAGAVFEQLDVVPQGWRYAGKPMDSQPISLQIALKQGNLEAFEKAVIDMSTPDHSSYGQHFQSHDEMKRMLLPSEDSLVSVREWLHSGGVSDFEEDADWIKFRTTVGVVNDLLSTEFGWYSTEGYAKRLRTLEYSVPDAVAAHINTIQPTIRFGQIRSNHATLAVIPDSEVILDASSANLTACNSSITPQCLQDLYNIDYKASATSGSKMGFCSYLEEYARYADLELFEENIAPYAKGQNFSVVQFHGGLNNQTDTVDDSGEANLDLQYIVGISSPLPVTEFSTGGRGPLVPDLDQPDQADNGNEPYLDFLQNVLKLPQDKLPQVISTSYGEDEQSVPKSFALSVCNLFAQLGSRGVSVVFSSGDNGVGTACQSNDGKNTTKFQPQFPAACPWVTSVGSTRYVDETATYFSSGGFSNYWSTPLYQLVAVKGYLAKLGPKTFEGLYNPNGRGFPDVAAQGYGYAVYDEGSLKHYQGTSCSAPMFAATIGLLNDARLKADLPPLGFLNPWIYTIGYAVLNDITKGGSTGCDGFARFHGAPNGSPVVPHASWNATKGWDPVTGVGTPNFAKMLKAAVPFRYRS